MKLFELKAGTLVYSNDIGDEQALMKVDSKQDVKNRICLTVLHGPAHARYYYCNWVVEPYKQGYRITNTLRERR